MEKLIGENAVFSRRFFFRSFLLRRSAAQSCAASEANIARKKYANALKTVGVLLVPGFGLRFALFSR